MHSFKNEEYQIFYDQGGVAGKHAPLVVWGHGWAQDHASFALLIKSLVGVARHIALDLPGFGQSPVPFARIEESWGSLDYARAVACFIRDVAGGRPVIWIGHSFGCRVGVQLAAHYPDLVQAMVLIAGAGLKRKRSVLEWLHLKGKVYSYKLGKFLWNIPVCRSVLNAVGVQPHGRGSTDYQNAGPMRGVLVKVVNENLADEARRIQCPVLLIYGDKDTETPIDIGQRYAQLIKNAHLVSLSHQDHYSVLSESGRHQVVMHVKRFIEGLTEG